tara:strand:+ start:204 stop:620 length:417 start_codon:yes stop_codon:yes gene_type:complete
MPIDVSDEYRKTLLEQAAWNTAGVVLPEGSSVLEEASTTPSTKEDHALTCPLCESDLSEELSEAQVSDHLEMVVSLLGEASEEDAFENMSLEEMVDSLNEEELDALLEELNDDEVSQLAEALNLDLDGEVVEEDSDDE